MNKLKIKIYVMSYTYVNIHHIRFESLKLKLQIGMYVFMQIGAVKTIGDILVITIIYSSLLSIPSIIRIFDSPDEIDIHTHAEVNQSLYKG